MLRTILITICILILVCVLFSVLSKPKPFQWCHNPGYPWSVPRLSLPSCLGLLKEYQLEWWFYVGYLLDDQGVYYSVEFTVIRSGVGNELTQVVNGGIKVANDRTFKSTDSYGLGASTFPLASLHVPTVTDTEYRVRFQPLFGADRFMVENVAGSGVVGQPGTRYVIDSSGKDKDNNEYHFQFEMQDAFGGRMEGVNGFIGVAGGNKKGVNKVNKSDNSSYEWCFPWHVVKPGGRIQFDGKSSTIREGWMWLDRQVITYEPGAGPLKDVFQSTTPSSYTLYTGNWIACILPGSNTAFYVACGWPKRAERGQQWRVGADLGFPEDWRIGAVWGPPGADPQGVNMGDRFRLNVMDNVDSHWTSPTTGNTYCSAWKLTFDEKGMLPTNTFYFQYFRPDCETVPITGAPFMECAARVFTDAGMRNQVGWAWVEQMGLN